MLLRSPTFWAGCIITLAAFTLTEEFYEPIYNKLRETLGGTAANIISSIGIALAGGALIFLGYKIVSKYLRD